MIVEDRLSTLPEEIITYILSLMPTNFAMRTSILSKRWRYTWMLVENLDFDDAHDCVFRQDIFTQTVTQFVDRVLKFRRNSHVKLFRLHIRKSWVKKKTVSRWMDQAVKLNVQELDIDVFDIKLPLSLFTCKTLTKLRINCDYGYDPISSWKWPSSVCLPCLKSLDIVVLYDPLTDLFTLINGCPVLESLSLDVVWCENQNFIFNIPTLKQLDLTLGDCSRGDMSNVVLNVPNLEYLFTSGIPCSRFVKENVSSLVEAWVLFDGITYDIDRLMETDYNVATFSSEEEEEY